MKKGIIFSGLAFSLFYGQIALAENSIFFSGSGSHFRLSTSFNTLSVLTTTPNRAYPNAGIQILTPGYTVSGNVRPTQDGFYLFSVSDSVPGTMSILGAEGTVNIKICLNGVGKKYTCENQVISIQSPPPPPPPPPSIIFITSTDHTGNLGGVSGADAICQAAAYQAGSIIPVAGLTFKALLVTSTRYPCSSINGGLSGSCGGIFANDWPLVIGTAYKLADGVTDFNTVNQSGVFDGANAVILNEMGATPTGSSRDFWIGIQSILSNSSASDIVAWAYTDMNSAADNTEYSNNLATCNDFTDASGTYVGSYGSVGTTPSIVGTVPSSTWGNYYSFNNGGSAYMVNIFNASNFSTCDSSTLHPIVCVSQ